MQVATVKVGLSLSGNDLCCFRDHVPVNAGVAVSQALPLN